MTSQRDFDLSSRACVSALLFAAFLSGCASEQTEAFDASFDASASADSAPVPDAAPEADAGSATDGGARDASSPPDAAFERDAGVLPDAGAESILPMGGDAPVDGTSSFAELVATLAPGEWLQYESEAPERFFEQGEGGHRLDWADSAVWDPASGCLLHYGGGHLTIPALTIYCVGTGEWIRGPLPPWLDLEGSFWGYTNHGYDRNAFDPRTRTLFFSRNDEVWSYSLGSNSWRRSIHGHRSDLREFAVHHPDHGVLIGAGNAPGLLAFEPASEEARPLAAPFHGALHSFGQYSPRSGVMLYGGGDGRRDVYRFEDGEGRPTALAPEEIRTVSSGGAGGWVVEHPTSGDFLFLSAPTGIMHRYRVAADRWESLGAGPLGEGARNAMAVSMPEYGCVLFLSRRSGSSATATVYRPAP